MRLHTLYLSAFFPSILALQNRGGLLFFIVIYFALTSLTALPTFINGRTSFMREVSLTF